MPRRAVRRVHRLGFRGALLEQEHGQQHVRAHLQELAFPVLHRRFKERTAGEVVAQGDAGLPMFGALLVVVAPSCDGLADQKADEQREQDQGQGARNEMMDLKDLSDEELQKLEQAFDTLARATGHSRKSRAKVEKK